MWLNLTFSIKLAVLVYAQINKSYSANSSSLLQKWSKGKQKEKVNNMVLFDQATYDKLLSEVPKYKLITPSILSDRLRVRKLFIDFLISIPLYIINYWMLSDIFEFVLKDQWIVGKEGY